ncbi:MAG: RND transporter [Thiothrix sp.]|nr:MAG: RND transporter [Thiothrix sp.]
MQTLSRLLSKIPLSLLVIACLTLGLAPFFPVPHVWEKLELLANGALSRPIDIFDLILHGTPWILLILRLLLVRSKPA